MKIVKSICFAFLSVSVVIVSAVATFFLIDWNSVSDEAESFASGALGRQVDIGRLDVEPGWVTRLQLADVRIANAEWAEHDVLAAASTVAVSFEAWPLLSGSLVLPEIVIGNPRLSLERDRDGCVNWNLGVTAEVAGDVAAPESRDEFPEIGRLQVKGGKLRLARGNANLSSERLDFRFEARPKDFSLVDASSPVLVKGQYEDPAISIGSQGALPFFRMGKATDVDCARLLRGELDYREIEAGGSRAQDSGARHAAVGLEAARLGLLHRIKIGGSYWPPIPLKQAISRSTGRSIVAAVTPSSRPPRTKRSP